MKMCVLAAAGMLASIVGAYEEPVYTVTVAEGTNSLDAATVEVTQNGETVSAAFSSLALDKGGTFVKKGLGWLQSSSAMSVFTGEVVVAEGALILTEDGQAGRILNNDNYRVSTWTNCASLVVSNGATVALITSSENTFPHLVQPVSLSGEGLDGLGAIYHCTISGENKGTQLYYSHITLNGDTKIVFEDDGRLGIGYCVVDMNGYDLTCETPGENRGNLVLCGLQVKNPGNIVGDHTQLYFSSSKTWEGTAANTVTLTNNAYFRMYNFGGKINWTLVNDSENLVGYSDSGDPTWNEPGDNIWHGPWCLNENVTLGANTTATDDQGISLVGSVSGDGGITLRHQWLRLRSRSNTFKGGVTVTTSGHLVLYGNGSIPANGGTLKIQNGGEVILDEANAAELGLETMAYPAIDWNVPSGSEAVLPGTTNTIIKSLVKRGSGTLNLVGDIAGTDYHMGVATVTGVTEIASGTLRIPCGSAGICEGWVDPTIFGKDSGNDIISKLEYTATNRVALGAELAYTTNEELWLRDPDEKSKSLLLSYHGYVWNRKSTPVTWVFAQSMWKGSHLYIDGNRYDGYHAPGNSGTKVNYYHGGSPNDNKRVAFYTVTVDPGPHRIDMRTYTQGSNNNTGRWGPCQYEPTNAVWKANFGWAVNWSGSDSTNHVDFSEIRDPGDGSLFTVTTNGADMTIASLRTSFEHLKFTGGTLDVYGSDLYVPVLECGSGSITNSNEYLTDNKITVTGSMRVDSASYKGGTLKIDGKLRFAEGATLDGVDLALLSRGEYSLVEAADGIEGVPAFDSNADGNKGWRVKKTVVDGVEKLVFGWHMGTVVTFR